MSLKLTEYLFRMPIERRFFIQIQSIRQREITTSPYMITLNAVFWTYIPNADHKQEAIKKVKTCEEIIHGFAKDTLDPSIIYKHLSELRKKVEDDLGIVIDIFGVPYSSLFFDEL